MPQTTTKEEWGSSVCPVATTLSFGVQNTAFHGSQGYGFHFLRTLILRKVMFCVFSLCMPNVRTCARIDYPAKRPKLAG